MNRTITTECSEELYNENIKPYVKQGYNESDVVACLIMAGATCIEEDANMKKDFEASLALIQLVRIMAEVFDHEN